MSEFFCIYTGKLWPETARSKEHIVAVALGGSEQLVTYDVSKDGNSSAGHAADGLLINERLIEIERFSRKLASESGRVPPYRLDGEIVVDADLTMKARTEISPEGVATTRLRPKVTVDEQSFTMHCDQLDVDEKLAELKRSLARKGKSVENVSVTKTEIKQPRISGPFPLRPDAMIPCFVKMAIAMGHRTLGYGWSRGDHADVLRRYLKATSWEERDAMPLSGCVWPRTLSAQTFDAARMNDMMRVTDDHHVLAVLRVDGGLLFYGLLFGKFDGVINLGSDAFGLPLDSGVVTTVHTLTRTVQERPFELHNRPMPRSWIAVASDGSTERMSS